MPVNLCGAQLSISPLVESIVVNGRLHPWAVPARSGLEGGRSKADDAEERGLSVVSSMVITLRALVVLACKL